MLTRVIVQSVLTGHASGHAADLSGPDSFRSYFNEAQTMPASGFFTESRDDECDHTGDPPSVKGDHGGASKETSLYRKPSFLICQAVTLVIGIGLLFLLLYPVVNAIAQHIVNVSKLNVDRVAIAGPANTS